MGVGLVQVGAWARKQVATLRTANTYPTSPPAAYPANPRTDKKLKRRLLLQQRAQQDPTKENRQLICASVVVLVTI